MTQVILMLSQLVLLPLQVHLWGQSATANWYSALALATITYVVDCGLRTAGHSELMKANTDSKLFSDEAKRFGAVWGWIRVLILVVTVTLVSGDFVLNRISHSGSYSLWHIVLILACALETVLIIRITYLDSLGKYRGAEASYFFFAVLRLALSLPALLIFHWGAGQLATIYLVTSVAALFGQGHWLCKSIPLLKLSAPVPSLPLAVLALARHTVAEPVANWARLSLPVLVIGQIASPMAVTTYVALRAVFGAGRTTIQQLARVASVEVLRSRSDSDPVRAESLLTVFILSAVFLGSCVGFFVVVDNMRLLGLWLKHFDRSLFQQIALAFALTAPFFSYQIPMNLMFRTGALAWVARRHYAFVGCSAVFAAVCVLLKSLPSYLGLLVLAEVILSIGFFATGKSEKILGESRSGSSALKGATLCSVTTCLLWLAAHQNAGNLFAAFSFLPLLESAAFLLAATAAVGILLYSVFGGHVNLLLRSKHATPALAVAE